MGTEMAFALGVALGAGIFVLAALFTVWVGRK